MGESPTPEKCNKVKQIKSFNYFCSKMNPIFTITLMVVLLLSDNAYVFIHNVYL